MSDFTATKRLAQLVHRKHELLRRIQELVRRQVDIVSAREISKLLPLLAAKQQLLEDLQAVERGLDPYRDDDPEARQWEAPEERQACAAQAAENQTLLQAILTAEKSCEEALVAQRQTTLEQLQENRSAREALQAYQQPMTSGARLDLSSE